MALAECSTLNDRLAKALPEGCRFEIHHLSSPPTRCTALYAAPPNEETEETYCESHFLSVSVKEQDRYLQIFAIEVLIYSTERLTTLFVSKADSTGYLSVLNLPQGTQSPLRIISTTFLKYLIDERKRLDRPLVLSLFARAQNQYLFPGSIENAVKHVLDDRSLIKWWCKVVDPLLATYENDSELEDKDRPDETKENVAVKSHGYLRVPGCDKYGTQSFFPKNELDRKGKTKEPRWSTEDPLRELRQCSGLPERCLIPRFPDDPKARFVLDLDDELPDKSPTKSQSQSPDGSSKIPDTGRWRSVRSLEQFWEMMSFRQECSAGRLVGFLWAVFRPARLCDAKEAFVTTEASYESSSPHLPTPQDSHRQRTEQLSPGLPLKSNCGPGLPLTPPVLSPESDRTHSSIPTTTPIKVQSDKDALTQPEKSNNYCWPTSSRGEIVLRQREYNRVGSLLLRLDYADEKIAANSTRKWIDDVADRAGVEKWGKIVVGESRNLSRTIAGINAGPTTLDAGLIRKKKRIAEEAHLSPKPANEEIGVNVLSTGLVRKKIKAAHQLEPTTSEESKNIRELIPG